MTRKKMAQSLTIGNVGVNMYQENIEKAINDMTIEIIGDIADRDSPVLLNLMLIKDLVETSEKSISQLREICRKARNE
ncbi:MAG: hypothetical protein V1701_02725 [Planctomycetota bacterium]